ncbi:MCM DNA helicase complex subunit [Cymbomonas tetramitiformis]|uniref:DNA replication licensing factor MCM3 n=1 Tax=Cymbomonas tetramitiformis TaxID=36881 RepID=A0AAE0G4C6_9CHLO|nr:MCM DNA helicase complex subunit [Cymbomonas tetramitiformis]
MADITEARLAHKSTFTDFLDQDHGQGDYVRSIKEMVGEEKHRLLVDLSDLRNFNPQIAQRLIERPGEYLPPFEEALEEVVRNHSPKFLSTDQEVHIGLKGSFGFHRVSPRELLSPLLSKLVMVEGIVTKCSNVRPKLQKSVHYCAKTKEFTQREYRDATSNSGVPTGASYPTRDSEGNVLVTEFGLCKYRDHQTLCVQEMPENAPAGQLPCSIDVVLEDDLVDTCKPGDRIGIVGIFKAVSGTSASTSSSGVFRTLVVGTTVRQLSKEIVQPSFTPTAPCCGEGTIDRRPDWCLHWSFTGAGLQLPADMPGAGGADRCGGIGGVGGWEGHRGHAEHSKLKRKDLFDVVADSLAPSIYGHHMIKKALALQLLGGNERNLANGTHLRGDINVLLIGDPSVAKSQMLRAVMNVAPLAISTTGRGSSGVGLTAAVTTEEDTNERRLEAGAMVLADRGVVCIDEFDKMSEADRVAIHEVMEQQTVTIAKAGIHASLNARCSVLAAANPIYGGYDHSRSVTYNIALPDSLLSRFDIVFVVLDQSNTKTDKLISEHVLRMHRFRKSGNSNQAAPQEFVTALAEPVDDNEEENMEEDSTPMWVKYNRTLHGGDGGSGRGGGARRDLLSTPFLKKFMLFCKNFKEPELNEEAMAYIGDKWKDMRADRTDKTLPVTARTLESMIRLSAAHAKLRQSKHIALSDAEAAIDVMNYAIYAEEKNKMEADKDPLPDSAPDTGGGGGDDGNNDGDDGNDGGRGPMDTEMEGSGEGTTPAAEGEAAPEAPSRASKRRRTAGGATQAPSVPAAGAGVDDARRETFMATISNMFHTERVQELRVEAVKQMFAESGEAYSVTEIETLLKEMNEVNGIFYNDGVVYSVS